MRQSELNRLVCEKTGESRKTVARYGWLLSEPWETFDDPHDETLGPWVIDFDSQNCDQDFPHAELPIDALFA
ncbi:MAG: hypothetical protein ABJM81_25425 [Rhodopirellula bahusiensis]|uniref:hypothetical protein n=1 Tax=Rhodopirellula bahusiensis TaxID=2014065 RepID=UPI0032670DB5